MGNTERERERAREREETSTIPSPVHSSQFTVHISYTAWVQSHSWGPMGMGFLYHPLIWLSGYLRLAIKSVISRPQQEIPRVYIYIPIISQNDIPIMAG